MPRCIASRIAPLALFLVSCAACAPPKDERETMPGSMKAIADRHAAPEGAKGEASGARPIPGRADYDDAIAAVGANDLPRAMASLKRAVAANPECAEYWYNLGAAQANRSIEVVGDSEAEALRLFGESVDSKRRSLELMNAGRFQIYDAQQQARVKSDAENGLRDADAVLADPQSLIAALKAYAAAR